MNPALLHRREAGMSLVELMVAMLIGLIGIVIITHLYVTNDQYKRSTTGVGGAQINGAVALYTMERDLRMAGYGVAHSMALNCKCIQPLCSPLQYYYDAKSSFPPAAGAAGALPPRNPVPVVITDNPGGPDQITLLYSVAAERMLPAQVKYDTAPLTNHEYTVESWEGFRVNNLVLVADNNGTCLLRQLTGVQDKTRVLEHATGGSFNPLGNIHPVIHAGSAVFDLGDPDKMVWRTYFVDANKLRSEDFLPKLKGEANAVQALVDDIVDLQAEYGWDGSATIDPTKFVVDRWGAAPPVDPTDPTKTKIMWDRIIAVRVGLLARSRNFEKPSIAGGACEATQAAPTWAGGAFTVPGGIPSCYKYRAFETVIPLRNMIWRSS
jgi:type IV pilus assembly protein PilW